MFLRRKNEGQGSIGGVVQNSLDDETFREAKNESAKESHGTIVIVVIAGVVILVGILIIGRRFWLRPHKTEQQEK